MLDVQKIAAFLVEQRRKLGMTQVDVASKLNVSYQAVSKWENGTLPNVEVLAELAQLFHVTADEILAGRKKGAEPLSYSRAGVDVAYTDAIKKEIAAYLRTEDPRVLNGLGPFASLYDLDFPEIKDPVLVLKTEEPGSKQKLAMQYGYTESVCHDMINHLVNDIAVMGAKPLAVLDCIVCSSAEKETIKTLLKGISQACKENECSLVGGETSIQPQVVEKGTYILSSSIAGIVSRHQVIDGHAIQPEDQILGVASNGLHTNGYSLVRMLLEKMPQIKFEKIHGETFLEQIMKPHTAYYKAIKQIASNPAVHGMAHITGGGMEGNLSRIIPNGMQAKIDLAKWKVLPLFQFTKEIGNIEEQEMLATFNCGIGLAIVVEKSASQWIQSQISKFFDCYEIGTIQEGTPKVSFYHHIAW